MQTQLIFISVSFLVNWHLKLNFELMNIPFPFNLIRFVKICSSVIVFKQGQLMLYFFVN